jgi:hypothetical protein
MCTPYIYIYNFIVFLEFRIEIINTNNNDNYVNILNTRERWERNRDKNKMKEMKLNIKLYNHLRHHHLYRDGF